jgi:hypothetical protein
MCGGEKEQVTKPFDVRNIFAGLHTLSLGGNALI